MDFIQELKTQTQNALTDLYTIEKVEINFEQTNPNFEGDFTFVVFPYLRYSKKKPEDTAAEIGEYLREKVKEVSNYNVVKGFLNLELSDTYWISVASEISNNGLRIPALVKNQKVVVEYSSHNTNKPLHLGHIRNNVLGYSICKILEANGYDVIKNNLVNDRGVHICKSMLAWQKWGNGETPESSGIKGDHLVGKYYVEFDKHYQKQISELVEGGTDKDLAKNEAPLMKETRQMLQQWEEGKQEVLSLWKKMNGWVYDGFDVTYNRLGVSFDKIY
ncbi:MAG: arginine--tRNA ligase, partial [Bacteroidia bacterium]|nr:arginine--tRNA ligase [Bacteroidia bacterium]